MLILMVMLSVVLFNVNSMKQTREIFPSIEFGRNKANAATRVVVNVYIASCSFAPLDKECADNDVYNDST